MDLRLSGRSSVKHSGVVSFFLLECDVVGVAIVSPSVLTPVFNTVRNHKYPRPVPRFRPGTSVILSTDGDNASVGKLDVTCMFFLNSSNGGSFGFRF